VIIEDGNNPARRATAGDDGESAVNPVGTPSGEVGSDRLASPADGSSGTGVAPAAGGTDRLSGSAWGGQSVAGFLRSIVSGGGLRSQTAWVVLGDGVTLVALMGTAMVLARIIQPGDMATFKQVTYLGMMAVAFTEIGLPAALYRYYRILQPADRVCFLWKITLAMLGLGVIGALGLLALSGPLAAVYHNEGLRTALRIGAAYPAVMLPFGIVRPLLICRGHSLRATTLETAFALGTAFSIIVPLWLGWTLDEALVVWISMNAFRLAVLAFYLVPELRRAPPRWQPDLAREVWRYTWPIQVSRLPSMAMVYLDKVITSLFMTKEMFASYALGARELPYLNKIPFSMSSVLLPRMVEAVKSGSIDRVCALWRKACLSTAVVTYPFAAFCVWQARPIMRALFTATYEAGAIPFAACAAITFVRVVEYASLAKALGDSKIILRVASLSAATSLPLALGLTYFWGIWGISVFLMLSQLIIAVYYVAHYKRLLQRSVHQFFPWVSLLAIGLLAFLSVVATDVVLQGVLHLASRTGAFDLTVGLGAVLIASAVAYAGALTLFGRLMPTSLSDGPLGSLRSWNA